MIRMLLLRCLLRLLEKHVGVAYTGIDDQSRREWLALNYREAGFVSYFKWRDLTLLKTLGNGLDGKEYWITVGRRLELLNLGGLMKDEFDKMERGTKRKEQAEEKKEDLK